MGLVDHAKKELELSGLFKKESDYNGGLGESTLELIEVFSKQGHSGSSAGMVRGLFHKLANYELLTALTFDDNEWGEIQEGKFQNKRNSAVFKDGKDGKEYYINAFYKKTQNDTTWHGLIDLPDGSFVRRCYIKDASKMPSICIDVIETEISKDDWEMVIKDIEQLDKLREFYDFKLEKREGE